MKNKEPDLEISILKIVQTAKRPYVILETNLGEVYSLAEGDVVSFSLKVTLS